MNPERIRKRYLKYEATVPTAQEVTASAGLEWQAEYKGPARPTADELDKLISVALHQSNLAAERNAEIALLRGLMERSGMSFASKEDAELFTRLFHECHDRDCDLCAG